MPVQDEDPVLAGMRDHTWGLALAVVCPGLTACQASYPLFCDDDGLPRRQEQLEQAGLADANHNLEALTHDLQP